MMERYVLRPFGELAAHGSGFLLVLLTGMAATVPDSRDGGEAERQPPTLMLSVAGDFQQAVHFNFDLDREEFYRKSARIAPLHPVEVSPHEWVKIYTSSPLGLPLAARARVYASARPEPCFGNVMIGLRRSRYREPRLFDRAPSRGGPRASDSRPPPRQVRYWIALDAAWGFGGRTAGVPDQRELLNFPSICLRVGAIRRRSQRGIAVYEFSESLIRRVYYFAAEK